MIPQTADAPRTPTLPSSRQAASSFHYRSADSLTAIAVFLAMLFAYNSNGREIRTYDSRPTALAARELLANGTLALDRDVAETPEYATRWGFILARDGHYRSIYSPVPAILAAALAWPASRTGIIDVDARMAPQLIAKVSASILVSIAVALVYLTVRRGMSKRLAVFVALGVGLGTGYWSSASQTLWQSETALFGLSLAVFCLSGPVQRAGLRTAAAVGLGLTLTLAARPQLAPAAVVLLLGMGWRSSMRASILAFAIVAAGVAAMSVVNMRWFGHPLGALPLLTSANADIHDTGSTFAFNAGGYLGLLFSPSRGLLVFSPIVLVAFAGIRDAIRRGRSYGDAWFLLAAAAQFLVYGSYSVWWGGHTFGPRYMIDLLPLLVPAAGLALARQHSSAWKGLSTLALAWSIVVAATGAFCYPNDAWNTNPTDVDRDHARLWSIRDNQIGRCWKAGLSPQAFTLLNRDAFRRAQR